MKWKALINIWRVLVRDVKSSLYTQLERSRLWVLTVAARFRAFIWFIYWCSSWNFRVYGTHVFRHTAMLWNCPELLTLTLIYLKPYQGPWHHATLKLPPQLQKLFRLITCIPVSKYVAGMKYKQQFSRWTWILYAKIAHLSTVWFRSQSFLIQ